MRKTLLHVFLFAAFMLGSSSAAHAQTTIEVAPRVSYNLDVEEIALGAEARFGVAALPVLIAPSAEFYLGIENGSLIEVDVVALYEFGGGETTTFTPYAGAGLAYTRFSFDSDFDFVDGTASDTGLAIVGGANFLLGNLKPFAQARITLGDGDSISLQGGVLFVIGGN